MNIEQEIRAQIEKNKGLKLAVGEINNHLSILEGLLRNERNDVQKQVDEAYKKGYDKGYTDKTNNDEVGKELAKDVYQKGYNDGKEYGLDESDMREAVSYQKGLDDAWEAARKIALMDTETSENVTGYFGLFRIMENLTPMQAIEKLKAYEEKQKAEDDIKVGDELEHTVSGYTSKAIFLEKIEDDEDWYKCLFWTGCGVAILCYPKSQFKRTGKHYDIDKILEAMKE